MLRLACWLWLVAAPFPAGAQEAHAPETEAGQPAELAYAYEPLTLDASPALARARELAAGPFVLQDTVPEALRAMRAAQWETIRPKPESALWRQEGLPFEISFYHPGFLYNQGVAIHVLDGNDCDTVPFSTDYFDYGDESLAEKMRQEATHFAGFAVHGWLDRLPGDPEGKNKFASFLGATYFRSMAKNTRYGLSARALALNTAMADGEEFPWFKEFWLVKPRPGDASFTLFALMDAPSLTGAFRFIITPGASTVMDVDCRLFLRQKHEWPAKIGFAPANSMYLFSETGPWADRDYRPEVHNSDGLLHTTGDAWYWCPLANPGRLAVSAFSVTNPRGFGLMQRDNNFDHYQDFRARFDRRPSLWIEPQGDWGTGRLELIEIPSTEEIHDNITLFWVPDSQDSDLFSGREAALAYRLYWMAPGITPHPLGRATATRMVRMPKNETTRFIIDFDGPELNELAADTGLSSVVLTPEDAPVLEKTLAKNPVTGGWRLDFTVRTPSRDDVVQSLMSAREGSPRLRFQALLKRGENLPDPLTEVWVYDLPS